MSSNQNIIPKDCSYQCRTRIFCNTAENTYFEVFTKQKHQCPNRSNQKKSTRHNSVMNNKPNYYNRFAKPPKPKMSNSLELLTGPINSVQKHYEILSDIVTEVNGKVHGSQSYVNGNNISLVVYYEVPEGKREECKQKFNTITKNNLILQR